MATTEACSLRGTTADSPIHGRDSFGHSGEYWPLRILIAGKQASLRSALKTLIRIRPGLQVVATAGSKEELFRLSQATGPDLLLLDEDLDEATMDSLVAPMRKLDPKLLIIILGQRSELRGAYLEAGVLAYVTKDNSPKSLLTAFEEARLQHNDV